MLAAAKKVKIAGEQRVMAAARNLLWHSTPSRKRPPRQRCDAQQPSLFRQRQQTACAAFPPTASPGCAPSPTAAARVVETSSFPSATLRSKGARGSVHARHTDMKGAQRDMLIESSARFCRDEGGTTAGRYAQQNVRRRSAHVQGARPRVLIAPRRSAAGASAGRYRSGKRENAFERRVVQQQRATG